MRKLLSKKKCCGLLPCVDFLLRYYHLSVGEQKNNVSSFPPPDPLSPPSLVAVGHLRGEGGFEEPSGLSRSRVYSIVNRVYLVLGSLLLPFHV